MLAAARESTRAEVVAVAARDRARADAYARENGIPRAFGSYEQLLADPDVQAVYISLPNSLHAEWSIRALQAGKHVLCEKPFSRHVSDVVDAYAAAEAAGALLMEAFMYRHHPQTAALIELLADGAVGTPQLVRAVFAFNAVRIFGDEGNVRFDPQLDGGALLDLGSYCVSSARVVGGEPARVHGTQVLGPTGVDVAFAGTLEFASGLIARFECAFTVEARTELEILGTEGRLLVPQPSRILEPGIELWTLGGHSRVECDSANSYLLQLDNFSAAIAGEQSPLLGRSDAVGQARVLEALAASAVTGDTVGLT